MPLKCYVGWDPRDVQAFTVCERSMRANASVPIEIVALRDWEVRASGVYWRSYHVDSRGQAWDDRDGKPFSTAFAFTRFCVPALEAYGSDPVLFCDADMMWRADVAELVEAAGTAALACVKHDHRPPESEKMGGTLQTVYSRKNWSSLMVMRPKKCNGLTPYTVNNAPGEQLHGMRWIDDADIKALDESWNWLDGWSSPAVDPKVVHHTRGTPDMPGCEHVAYADEWWNWLTEGRDARGQAAA